MTEIVESNKDNHGNDNCSLTQNMNDNNQYPVSSFRQHLHQSMKRTRHNRHESTDNSKKKEIKK